MGFSYYLLLIGGRLVLRSKILPMYAQLADVVTTVPITAQSLVKRRANGVLLKHAAQDDSSNSFK